MNVSNAFLEVAQRHLYREHHSTFENYLEKAWGIGRSQGHRLVLFGKVRQSPVGDRIANERQARESPGCLTIRSCCNGLSIERRRSPEGDR